MRFDKQHLAAVMGGIVVIATASYVLAQPPSLSDEVLLTQGDRPEQGERPDDERPEEGERPEGGRHEMGRPGHHPHPGFPRAIRAEAVVPARDGETFETVRFDRGILQRVDGTTIVIDEDDGTVVEIPTDEETRIGRDGERATLDDLQAGDHIFAVRVKEGDSFVTKGIRAVSEKRYEEMKDRYQERREHMRERRGDDSSS